MTDVKPIAYLCTTKFRNETQLHEARTALADAGYCVVVGTELGGVSYPAEDDAEVKILSAEIAVLSRRMESTQGGPPSTSKITAFEALDIARDLYALVTQVQVSVMPSSWRDAADRVCDKWEGLRRRL